MCCQFQPEAAPAPQLIIYSQKTAIPGNSGTNQCKRLHLHPLSLLKGSLAHACDRISRKLKQGETMGNRFMQPLRIAIQWFYLLFTISLGIVFYRFVLHYQGGDVSSPVARPDGI